METAESYITQCIRIVCKLFQCKW